MEETKVTEGITTDAVNPAEPEKVDYEKLYKESLAEIEKAKASITKANGEAASYKRQLSERLTKEEAEKLAQEEREKAMQESLEELKALKREKTVAGYSAKMMAAGIDAETANELSALLPESIPDQFFDGIKKFIAEETARIKAGLLKEQPKLSPGMPPTSTDAAKARDDALRRAFGFKK